MGGIIGCSPSLNYSILQWNTLCSTLATKESFPKVDENSLLWENRKKLIKEFLTQENPDILTIEEIDNFENFQKDILNDLPIKYIGNFFEKVDKKMGIYLGINPDKFLVIEEKKEILNAVKIEKKKDDKKEIIEKKDDKNEIKMVH